MPGEGPVKGHSQSVPRSARSGPLSPQEQLEPSADSRRVQDKDPRAQPSEPILFPKLRIRFADFPCLHCSIGQRLFTLETCCGYEYDRAWAALGPPDFQGSPRAHRTPRDVRCSSSRWTLPPAEPFPGWAGC
ncbi:unnamed protein product [Victoria cruziana]